jgi:hypothetical protein
MSGRNEKTLRSLLQRDNGICGICTKPVSLAEANIDHIIPKSLGGHSYTSNLRATHIFCNHIRGNEMTEPELRELDTLLWDKQNNKCFYCWEDLDRYKMRRCLKAFDGPELCAMHRDCRSQHLISLDRERRKLNREKFKAIYGR